MKNQTKTTMKKGLSLFLAVLMCLSAWVWVEPEHTHVHALSSVGTTNQTALSAIPDTVDTTMTTVVGRFNSNNDGDDSDDLWNQYGANYYKNVLYSPAVNTNNGNNNYTIMFDKTEATDYIDGMFIFFPETVLMYDDETIPMFGVAYEADPAKNKYIRTKCLFLTSGGDELSFLEERWKGSCTGHFGFITNMNATDNKNKLFYTSDKTDQYSTVGDWSFYSNCLKYTGTMSNSEYVKTISTTWKVGYRPCSKNIIGNIKEAGNGDYYSEAIASNNIYVVNVKAYRTIIEEALAKVKELKENPAKYTTASVSAFVSAVQKLVDLNPSLAGLDDGGSAAVAWGNNMTSAVAAYNSAKNGLTIQKYTVKFQKNDGTAAYSQSFDYGSSVNCSELAAKATNTTPTYVNNATHNVYTWDTSKYVNTVEDDVTITEIVSTASHSVGSVNTKDATCTAGGKKETVCADCKSVYKTETISALGHEFKGEKKVVTAATCDTEEIYQLKCTRCDTYSESKTGEKRSHNFTGAYVVQTNGQSGFHYRKCIYEDCSAYGLDTEVGRTETHTWKETSRVAATCEKNGTISYKCEHCDATYEDTTTLKATGHSFTGDAVKGTDGHSYKCVNGNCDAVGIVKNGNQVKDGVDSHEWNSGEKVNDATCTENGKTKYTCTVCYATEERSDIEAKGHDFTGDYVSKVNGENGKHYRKCKNGCGAHGMVVDGKQVVDGCEKHDFTSKVTTSATCTAPGVKTYTCSLCGDTYDEIISATGHNFNGSLVKDENGTGHAWKCSNDNCEAYGYVNDKNEQVVGYTAHTWDDGKVTKAATCEETGEKTFTCTVCEETKTEVIDPLGHNFTGKLVNKGEDGHAYQCTSCDVTGTVVNGVQTKNGTVGHELGDGTVTTEPTCTESGVRTFTCSCGYTTTKTEDATGHNDVHNEAQAPEAGVCGARGWYGYVYCDKCNTIVIDGKTERVAYKDTNNNGIADAAEYASAEHSLVKTEAEAPTCKDKGNIEYWYCSNCCKYFKTENAVESITKAETELDTVDHVYENYTTDNNDKTHTGKCKWCDKTNTVDCSGGTATCVYKATCTTCGGTYGNVDMTNHVHTTEYVRVDSTCQKEGHETYKVCNDCEKEIVAKVVISKKAHDFSGIPVSNGEGQHVYTCVTCKENADENLTKATNTEACSGGTAYCHSQATCEKCNGLYGEKNENNHENLTKHEYKDSTCTAEGNKEYYTCDKCNKLFWDEAGKNAVENESDLVVDKKAHDYNGKWISDKNGKHYKLCQTCNTEKSDPVDCGFSDWSYNAETGKHEHTCNGCGYTQSAECSYGEYKYNPETESHYKECSTCHHKTAEAGCNFSEATCVAPATCSECKGTKGEKNSTNHKGVNTVEEKDSTCKVRGYYEYKYCEDCKQPIEEIQYKDLAEHKYGDATPVTKGDDNREIGYHSATCTVCGDTNDKIKCSGGDDNEVTCSTRKTCSVCGGEYGLYNKDKHTEIVTEKALEATCQHGGYSEYKYCEACGETITEKVQTDRLQHSYGAWVCDEGKGTHTRKCTTCVEDAENDLTIETQTEACSGGTANCIDKKACDVCHGKYGEVDNTVHKTIVNVQQKDPTCQKEGKTAYKYCSACKTNITEPETLDKVDCKYTWASNNDGTHTGTCEWCKGTKSESCSGGEANCQQGAICEVCGNEYTKKNESQHTNVVDVPEVPATCRKTGTTAGTKCDDCGKVVSGCEETPLADHVYNEENAKAVKVNGVYNGKHSVKCENCGSLKLYDCTLGNWMSNSDGTHTKTCKYCHSTVTDNCALTYKANKDGTHTAECNDCAYTVTEEHSGGKATCSTQATCEHCLAKYGKLNAENHESENTYIKNQKDATCTEKGYTGDVYYSCCDALKEAGKETAKAKHEFTELVSEVKSTCTTYGSKTLKCANCDEETVIHSTVLDPTNHASDKTTVVGKVDATCTEAGYTGDVYYTCCYNADKSAEENVNALKEKGETDPVKGHDFSVVLSETKSTCISEGKIEYKCSRCEETNEEIVGIDATNHASTETITVGAKVATCTEAGYTGDVYHACCYDADKSAAQNAKALISKGSEIATNGTHTYTAYYPEYMLVLDGDTAKVTKGEDGTYSFTLKDGEITYADKVAARHDDGNWYHARLCTVCGTLESTACYSYSNNANCVETDNCELCSGICSLLAPNTHKGGLVEVKEVYATCQTTGVKAHYECKECSKKFLDKAGTQLVTSDAQLITAKTAHSYDFDNGVVTKEPSCGVNGEHTYYCTTKYIGEDGKTHTCSSSITKADIPSDGVHNWSTDYKVIKDSTCMETGKKALYCTVCGEAKSGSYLIIPVKEHTYDDGVVTTAPTCTEDGVKTYTCTFSVTLEDGTVKTCAHTKTEVVPATGHKNVSDWQTVASTCSVHGYKYKVCQDCKKQVEKVELPLASHTPSGKWIVIKQPTCSSTGIKQDSCTVCGKTYTEEIAKTEHNPVVVPGTDATCTTPGCSESVVCADCGTVIESATEIPVDSSKHYDHDGDGYCDGCKYDMLNGQCNCICHKNHWLMRIIYKILRFFWKLFGIGKSCRCGHIHY